MIKNIHVHSFFLFFLVQHIIGTVPVIEINNFSEKNIEALFNFHKLHADKEYHIKVIPQSSFISRYGSFFTKKYEIFTSYLTFASFGKIFCAGALSLGWISYILCAYIIYRIFKLLKKIDSWIGWICDDTLLIYDDELLWENMSYYHKRNTIFIFLNEIDLDEEKFLLEKYFLVDRLLKKYRLRHIFPYHDKINQQKIRNAYITLQQMKKLKKTILRGGSFCQKTL